MTGATGVVKFLTVWIGLYIGIVVIGYFWSLYTVHSYRYDTTNNTFSLLYGIIFKNKISIPLANIQKVDIFNGPLERMLGIVTLEVSTASPNENYVSLPGLNITKAEELRNILTKNGQKPQWLLRRAKASLSTLLNVSHNWKDQGVKHKHLTTPRHLPKTPTHKRPDYRKSRQNQPDSAIRSTYSIALHQSHGHNSQKYLTSNILTIWSLV